MIFPSRAVLPFMIIPNIRVSSWYLNLIPICSEIAYLFILRPLMLTYTLSCVAAPGFPDITYVPTVSFYSLLLGFCG